MSKIGRLVVAVAVVLLSPVPSRAAGPWTYAVRGPGGSTTIDKAQIGQVLYFELDATVPDYVWGNVRVDFDPKLLECVSVEESPEDLAARPQGGFWTAWVDVAADPAFGGGGVLYFYDDNGLGSDWAAWWAATAASMGTRAGPVASYDNAAGIIRFYVLSPAGGYLGSLPLRLGFLVKKAGTAVFTTSANDWEAFGFPAAPAAAGAPAATATATATAITAAAGEGYSWRPEDLPYRLTSEVTLLPAVRTVAIDILPEGSCGRLPAAIAVAILGAPDLDVTAVDVASVALGGMPVKAVGKLGRLVSAYEDVNGDGLQDLRVVVENTGALAGATEATLTGTLRDGTAIQGTDGLCGN
jgi:hypothetical protein